MESSLNESGAVRGGGGGGAGSMDIASNGAGGSTGGKKGDEGKEGGIAGVKALGIKAAVAGRMLAASARPWNEAFDRNSFAKPANVQEATARIRKNFHYFKINYLLSMTVVLLMTMVVYPKSLMVLSGVLMMWVYLYAVRTAPLVINGTPIDGTSKLVTCSAITMLVVFFLTDVGGLLLWAFTFGCIIIAVHGALRVPDDLFVDETEMNTGFFSMPMATAV